MDTNDVPKYWTVTIQVHEVTPPQPMRDKGGYALKVGSGHQQSVVMSERQVRETFSTTVRASDESEAYRKAMALLEVNRPDVPAESEEIRDGMGGLITRVPRRAGSETLGIPPKPMPTRPQGFAPYGPPQPGQPYDAGHDPATGEAYRGGNIASGERAVACSDNTGVISTGD